MKYRGQRKAGLKNAPALCTSLGASFVAFLSVPLYWRPPHRCSLLASSLSRCPISLCFSSCLYQCFIPALLVPTLGNDQDILPGYLQRLALKRGSEAWTRDSRKLCGNDRDILPGYLQRLALKRGSEAWTRDSRKLCGNDRDILPGYLQRLTFSHVWKVYPMGNYSYEESAWLCRILWSLPSVKLNIWLSLLETIF